MYTAPESWKMTEPEKIVALIKEIELWRLGNWDGCCCSSFSIRNVDVEISCGKGREQAVWISSRSMDYHDRTLLKPVMAEVIRQLTPEQTGRSGKFAEHIIEIA